jgi:hypothetical protein
MNLLLLFPLSIYIVVSAWERARTEARLIQASTIPLGYAWHAEMWLTGKAVTGVVSAAIFGLSFLPAPNAVLYGAASMGLYAMGVYWLTFDLALNAERGKGLFYISSGSETAFSDKLLLKVQAFTGLSARSTHLGVKVPLILIGLLACIVASL